MQVTALKTSTQEGPELSNCGGELAIPIQICGNCKYLGVHDMHYFYCSAQDAPNKHAGPKEYAYPWHGAGIRLQDDTPNDGCPFKNRVN